MSQFMREKIAAIDTRGVIFARTTNNVLSKGECACTEASREMSGAGLSMNTHLIETMAETVFHKSSFGGPQGSSVPLQSLELRFILLRDSEAVSRKVNLVFLILI